jgi:hypothetical protein
MAPTNSTPEVSIPRRSLLVSAFASLPFLAFVRWTLAAKPDNGRWRNSQAYSASTPVALRALANDRSLDRKARARAIFSLFASHIRPPANGVTMANILSPATWLVECRLDGVYALGGKIPVEMGATETAFCLRLFPNSEGWSEWVIYFTLPGGRGRPVSDARDLLAGKVPGGEDLRMNEFALCFPAEGKARLGRTERFTARGISAYGPW